MYLEQRNKALNLIFVASGVIEQQSYMLKDTLKHEFKLQLNSLIRIVKTFNIYGEKLLKNTDTVNLYEEDIEIFTLLIESCLKAAKNEKSDLFIEYIKNFNYEK